MKQAVFLLKRELALDKRALEKSVQSFNEGDIDLATHKLHKSNIEPRIQDFSDAITVLEKRLK